jgi:hypothetical protein
VVDTGDADVEVHNGDRAIIKTRDLDPPALRVSFRVQYDPDPIFGSATTTRRGSSSRPATSGNAPRTAREASPTVIRACLAAACRPAWQPRRHPDRPDGDYRFSFILPIRPSDARKPPTYSPEPIAHTAVVAPTSTEACRRVKGPGPCLPALKLFSASASLSWHRDGEQLRSTADPDPLRHVQQLHFPPFLVTVAWTERSPQTSAIHIRHLPD